MSSFGAAPGEFNTRIAGGGDEIAASGAEFVQALGRLMAILTDAPEKVEQAFRVSVIQLFEAMVMGTPVDTGRARAGWRGPDFKVQNGAAVADISNSVEYVVYLEYGWSKQAPHGMIRVNLHRMASRLEAQARAILLKRAKEAAREIGGETSG